MRTEGLRLGNVKEERVTRAAVENREEDVVGLGGDDELDP